MEEAMYTSKKQWQRTGTIGTIQVVKGYLVKKMKVASSTLQHNAASSRKEFAPVKMFSHEAIGSLTKV